MIKDNKNYNEKVKPNTEFLKELKSKLPQFFINEKYDEEGNLISEGYFDIERFQESLRENNIYEIKEGYQLSFIGKDYAKKQAGEKPTTVVVPDNKHNQEDINANSKNLFFTGDNIELLRHFQSNYKDSIDVIYIDPPYNTGNDGFVYPDNFEYSDEVLQDVFGLNETELNKLKSIQGKSTHSAWLTFMYPRMYLAKKLLNSTGYIFISIDDNENANLKLVLNEVFGESNYIGEIIRNTNSSKNQSLFLSTSHDYCLIYAKDITVLSEKHASMKWQVNKNNIQEYLSKIDYLQKKGLSNDDITEELKTLTKYPRFIDFENYWYFDDRGLYRKDNLGGVKNGNTMPIFNPLTQKNDLVPPGGFRFNVKKMNELILEDRIHFHTDGSLPTIKRYLSENKKQNPKAIMSDDQRPDDKLMKEYGTPFSNPKQLQFMKRIISIADLDAIVLDFFAGSSTTADAVMQLNAEDGGNRQFIMVQLDEPTYIETDRNTRISRKGSETAFNAGYMSIDEISRERIKRASQKIRDDKGLTLPENFDGGFKHYRVVKPTQASINDLETYDPNTGMFVDSKGMQVAFSESGFDDMIQPFSSEGLGVSGDATGVDTILTTWMIQDGYKLDNEVHQLEIDGYNVFYVEPTRVYLIGNNWNSNNTKMLLNKIGNYDLNVQTVVIYGYSFGLESIRELELGLKQLPNKVNLVKRY